MRRLIILFGTVLLIVALSGMAAGTEWTDVVTLWTSDLFAGKVGVPFTNWYEVADWEAKVCFDWGGDKDPNELFGDTIQGEIYHDLVIALQAQGRNPLPEEYSQYSGQRLYEVSWYVQPTQLDESMNFEVWLVKASGERVIIGSGSSNYVNGFRDYYSEFSDANYTSARMHYWNQRTDDVIIVPVVEG